jgi:hypothetical protein
VATQGLRARLAGGIDYILLVALAAWSLVSLLVVASGRPHQGVFTGADGIVAIDQLQYLSWVREAADSVLVSNRLDLAHGDPVFLHPVFAISGLLYKAGLSVQLSLLVWKPVAVAALFLGFRGYVRRLLGSKGQAFAALALGLFFYYPIQSLLTRLSLGTAAERSHAGIPTLELFPAGLLWGYLPSALAIGLMPLFLLAVERLVDPSRRAPGRGPAWYGAWSVVAGLTASWLHPWRGMVLLGILAALVLWERDRRRYLAAAIPAVATAAPLVYYGALSRFDADWHRATAENAILKPPLWALTLTLIPLAVVAALGVRRRPANLQEKALVLWPVVSVVCYFVVSSFPSHALAGASLPLAVLAVRAWQRLTLRGARALGAVAVVAATLPGMLSSVTLLRDSVDDRAAPHFLAPAEQRAFDYLARSAPAGGVLSTPYLGMAVPGLTDHATWLGNYLWTPDYFSRSADATALFAGRLGARRAIGVVRRSGARFVLSDCRTRAALPSLLRPVVSAVHSFGCATVVEVRPG